MTDDSVSPDQTHSAAAASLNNADLSARSHTSPMLFSKSNTNMLVLINSLSDNSCHMAACAVGASSGFPTKGSLHFG